MCVGSHGFLCLCVCVCLRFQFVATNKRKKGSGGEREEVCRDIGWVVLEEKFKDETEVLR